ncbi:MAG: hypothetical protein ACI4RV_04700, partial [Eubacteriales bacterium]
DYFMVDNIRLYYNMPRVTYDVNLPAGQSAAKRMNITSDSSSDFTTTSESVKVGTAAPVLFIPGYTFLGWYNEQGERVSTITEQAKLTAQWAEVKPGLNTLTGTTEAETFESAEEGDRPSTITVPNFSDYKIVSVNNLAIGETAITGNDGSTKALRAEVIPNVAYYKTDSEGNQVLDSNGNPILTGESYPHFFILNNMENGRSYHFSFKIFSDAIFKNNVADHLWLMKAGVGDAYIDLGEVFRTNNKSYKWYSDTRTFAWDNTGENRINMQFRTQYKYGTTDKQPMYFYLDDVMLVPYYKITYKNTDGTEIETVQYLEFGSDGKPLTTYTPKKTNYPENIPGADGKSVQVCIGWATTENATVPETSISLANADIVLYPVWKTIELEDNTYGTLIYYNDFNGYQSTTAGNLKTGHTYVGGILKGNTVALNGGNANLSIAIDPADTTKSNQVLQITSTNNYARADLKFGTHLENFGNYTIIMDVYVPSANTTANINALVYINDNTSTHSVYSFNAKERDAWNANKAAGSFQVVQAGDHGAANSGKGKCFDNVYLCDRRASIPTGSVFYIDNLRLYYKPTCRVAYDYGAYTAEQVGGKAYQYLTTGVSVDTNNSLSLSNTGLTLAGWSKTKPAAEGTPDLVTSITDADIEEKEITLYAVWGEPSAAYAVSADNTVAFGKSDTTVTVTANHLTDWTCDTGYSDAEVTTTDTTLTVKAVGYSGVVTVTARSKLDGTEQTVKVFLICGNLQKPGLNVMTGTAYSEDFAEEARMMFTKTDTSFNMAWTSEAPEGTTGNDSASFVKVWGTKTGINADEYVRFFIPVPTESGRKYDVTFDTYSKVNISGDGVPENYEYMDYVGWLLDFREKDPANPNDDGHITFKNSDIYSATKAGTWYHHEYIDKEARHEDSSNISMQFKVSPNSANNPTGTADGTYRTDFEFYIDNLSVIPYYKVTYHIPTGEGELTYDDYFLPTDDNNFTPNSEYCPAACLYKVGMDGDWQSSDTPYQLTHEDIDVYVGTKTLTEHSIRVASTEAAQALRFSGSVSNEIIKGNQNTDIFEFGFIVSRSDFMIAAAKKSDVDETAYKTLLTFEGANVSTESANGVYVNGKGLPFVYGPSYRILNGKPEKQQITSNDQASFFTAALTGIPETYYKTP